MRGAGNANVLESLLDPLSRCLDEESARRIAEFRISPKLQARVKALAERANEGTLSQDEQAEYDAFIDAADFISLLQLKAQEQLRSR